MCTSHQNYLEALETVLAWNLPDEAISDAVNERLRLMAGFDAEEVWEYSPESFLSRHH